MPQQFGIVIRVDTDLAADLPAIDANESEIRDAVTNLILHAVDAMPGGGVLSLRSGVLDTDRVQLEVTDTGVGMDETTRSRCLELFFTTKGTRGAGLGLAMVYGTVERHGGDLQIISEPQVGTTMRLSFPIAPSHLRANSPLDAIAEPLPALRILVIDDDPMVLQSLLNVLKLDGHRIETADGAAGD
jgi:signal transduction histidine kinase